MDQYATDRKYLSFILKVVHRLPGSCLSFNTGATTLCNGWLSICFFGEHYGKYRQLDKLDTCRLEVLYVLWHFLFGQATLNESFKLDYKVTKGAILIFQ